MPRRLLNLLPHIVVAVVVENIGDEIERILVVLDVCVQAREVEPVSQVVLVDFAKVFVAARGDELCGPSGNVSMGEKFRPQATVARARTEEGWSEKIACPVVILRLPNPASPQQTRKCSAPDVLVREITQTFLV